MEKINYDKEYTLECIIKQRWQDDQSFMTIHEFNFQDHLWRPFIQSYEQLLKEIVEMIVKRPFEISDAKRCTLIYHPDLDKPDCYFAFDNVTVGRINFHSLGTPNVQIVFTPFPEFTSVSQTNIKS
jgi:hypothetical protein